MSKHLIQFSTGVASAEVAWRVVAEYGAPDVTLLTADTRALGLLEDGMGRAQGGVRVITLDEIPPDPAADLLPRSDGGWPS